MRHFRSGARRRLLLLACLVSVAGPARAAAPPMPPETVRLTYAVLAHGIRALTLTVALTLDGDRYALETATRPAGLFGAFISSHVDSLATGMFAGDAVRPAAYHSAGFSRGAQRSVTVEENGARPVVTELAPIEARRDRVPPEATAGAVDPLSAFLQLVRHAWMTGSCDQAGHVFDGARLSAVVARTVGTVDVPEAAGSPWHGPALACGIRSQLIAGFLHNADFERAHAPKDGDAMLAPVLPGVGRLPIRARFDTVEHGEIRLVLLRASLGPV